MTTYRAAGHAFLVCPRLLALDARHAVHSSKWPPCRRHGADSGDLCPIDHDHETALVDPEGHRTADFYWVAGCDTIELHFACTGRCHDTLRCPCGQQLVYADLDDPHDPAGRR
jgi:hypothetical protein